LKRPTSSGGKGTRAFIAKVQKNPSRGCETDTSMSLPVKCSTVESEFFFLNDMPTWTVFAKHPFYSLIRKKISSYVERQNVEIVNMKLKLTAFMYKKAGKTTPPSFLAKRRGERATSVVGC